MDGVSPRCRQQEYALSVENFKRIIKLAKNPSAIYYHYAPAILNNVRDKLSLQKNILCVQILNIAMVTFEF